MKKCTLCKEFKQLEEFYGNKRHKDGLAYWCRQCFSRRKKEYYKLHSEQDKARTKRYYIANKSKIMQQQKERNKKNKVERNIKRRKYCKENKEVIKAQARRHYLKHRSRIIEDTTKIWRLKRYGMTDAEYCLLTASQHNECAICKFKFSSESGDVLKSSHVDHDHTTKEVRGLLCYYCNIGIGDFKDSPELLQKAKEYLNRNIETNLKYARSARITLQSRLIFGNICNICSSDKKLCTDHDHSKGIVRGVLCRRCNNGLGFLKDSVILIQSAIDYLNKHKREAIDFSTVNCIS